MDLLLYYYYGNSIEDIAAEPVMPAERGASSRTAQPDPDHTGVGKGVFGSNRLIPAVFLFKSILLVRKTSILGKMNNRKVER